MSTEFRSARPTCGDMGGISLTALMRSWIAHAVVMGSLGCE